MRLLVQGPLCLRNTSFKDRFAEAEGKIFLPLSLSGALLKGAKLLILNRFLRLEFWSLPGEVLLPHG
jgi:hypothetical protein